MGVVVTLGWLGRISPGPCRLDTPVGPVTAIWDGTNGVTIENVPSYRHLKDVAVEVPGHGLVHGDVAWGGNWFFLVHGSPVDIRMHNLDALTAYAWEIRQALTKAGVTGRGGAEIDHIELFVEPSPTGANSRSFVLCPGKAYDRSPCGTGTSAKIACLAADGRLAPGEVWRQESVVGSQFEATYELRGQDLYPTLRGSAYVNAEADLVLHPGDPFCWGIRG